MAKFLQQLTAALSRLSKRERLILNVVVFFVSISLLDRLIIDPISFKMRSLSQAIEDEKTAIKRSLRLVAQKERIRAQSEKYDSAPGVQSEEEESTLILKEIENLASKSSVYLVDMKPGGLKESVSEKKYLINLNLESQVEQLIGFMYNLENSNHFFIIEKYQISPKSKESSVAKCSMTISKLVIP